MLEPVPPPDLRSAHEIFDQHKFEELLVYVAGKLESDPVGGDTKLNKVLCFSDFAAFARLGHTITGAEYHRQPNGPLARELPWIRATLIQRGDLDVSEVPVHRYTRRITQAKRPADVSVFDAAELEIVDQILTMFHGRTAEQVSADSHRLLAGWRVVGQGATIPPETVMVDGRPLSDARRQHAETLAKTHGWS
jgi:hypothetical protein